MDIVPPFQHVASGAARETVASSSEVKKLRTSLVEESRNEGSLTREWVTLHRTATGEVHRTDSFSLWRNRGSSSAQQQDSLVMEHVARIIQEAYPEEDLETEMLHRGFTSYLLGSCEKEGRTKEPYQVSKKELFGYLAELHLVRLRHEVEEAAAAHETVPFADELPQQIRPVTILASLGPFLSSKKITLGSLLGRGAFGEVFEASVEGKAESYAFKWETNVHPFNQRESLFWRQGDCAAVLHHEISNSIKPLFFILSVTKPGKGEEFYYVPALQIKYFGMQLPLGSKVTMRGQLMERAIGSNLQQLLTRKSISLNPNGAHFKNIAKALFKTLQEMQVHNLAHRDIKLENIIYDPITGSLRLLDFGGALRLRKRNKEEDGSHLNPIASREHKGTLLYTSPRVSNKEDYSSEIDFFSYAMVLLAMLHENDFRTAGQIRFPGANQGFFQDALFTKCDPRNYLDRYLEALHSGRSVPSSQAYSEPKSSNFFAALFSRSSQGSDSDTARERSRSASIAEASKPIGVSDRRSATEKLLARNPEIRALIDLAFQASQAGQRGLDAAQQLSEMAYLQE